MSTRQLAFEESLERDYELVKQALLRRHDLDLEGQFDQETDDALIALGRLRDAFGRSA